MKNRTAAAVAAIVLSASCASTVDSSVMRRQLGRLKFTDATLEQVEALQPRVQAPFRLAVSPPVSSLPWSPREIAVVKSWGDELRRAGVLSELVVLPELALDLDVSEENGWLEGLRLTAARHRADALLVVNVVQEQSHWINVLSVLDLTIVGLWFSPGHEAESVVVMEGLLIDNRSEYVYGCAITEGSARWGGPFAYYDERRLTREARLEALKDLGDELFERATSVAAAP